MLDGPFSTVPIEVSYKRLLTLLGSRVRMEERYGLTWEGPGPDSNPHDPHQIGAAWGSDGTLTSFIICGLSCELQTKTVGGLVKISFPTMQLENWELIRFHIETLFQKWGK